MSSTLGNRIVMEGSGPAVIFVHGVGLDRRVWADQMRALKGSRRAVSYDLPGHGADAAGAPARTMDLDAYADDLIAIMDEVGCGRATLVGGAFGGSIARRVAVRKPDRVAAMVLLSQVARRSAEASRKVQQRYAAAEAEGVAAIMQPALDRWFSAAFRASKPGAVALVGDMMSGTRRDAFLAAYHAFATTDAQLADEAHEIACPVMLVCGGDDGNSTPSESLALAGMISDAEVVVMPNVRHLISIEAPDLLNAQLLRFLAQLGRKSNSLPR